MASVQDNRPDIRPFLDLIRGKCREVLDHYRGYVELDDLVQEVAVWWYSANPESLVAYLQDAELSRLRRSVWRVAKQYADANRAAAAGYFPDDQVRYGTGEIQALLPLAMDPEGVPDGGGVLDLAGIRVHGNLAEGGDLLAAMVDVRRALHLLAEDDRQFLQLVHDLRSDWERVARHTEIQPDSCRRRHDRIVERMARSLNREEVAA